MNSSAACQARRTLINNFIGMKYEERFVLTTVEAAAIAFMALDGKQIK